MAARADWAGTGADQGGDRFRQAGQAANAITLGAQFGVESDAVQSGNTGFQASLTVEVPEVPSICEAGAEHAFVARDDDRAVVIRLDVGDEGEPRCGSPVRRSQRKIALVDAHRDLHDLGRQVHVLIRDAAEVGDGPFHQARDFLEQPRIIHDR